MLNGYRARSSAAPWRSSWRARSINDYGPLLRLGQVERARALLLHCRIVFEQENAVTELGAVLSALADVESRLGRPEAALHFEKASLRYKYLGTDPSSIFISYYNLASYLAKTDGDLGVTLTHRLASVLLCLTTSSGQVREYPTALARDLSRGGQSARAALPADFATVCATVQRVEGVRFAELMASLLADRAGGDELLRLAIAKAEAIAGTSNGNEAPAG